MEDRVLRVRSSGPGDPVEGTVRLRVSGKGPRWVARVYPEDRLLARMTLVSGATTAVVFVGDSAAAALSRAEAWLRERYDVLDGADA